MADMIDPVDPVWTEAQEDELARLLADRERAKLAAQSPAPVQAAAPAQAQADPQYDPAELERIQAMMEHPSTMPGVSEQMLQQQAQTTRQAPMQHERLDPSLRDIPQEPAPPQPQPGVDPATVSFMQQPTLQPTGQPTGAPRTPRIGIPGTKGISEQVKKITGIEQRHKEQMLPAIQELEGARDQLATARELVSETKQYIDEKQADTLEAGVDSVLELRKRMADRRDEAQRKSQQAMDAYQAELEKQMKEKPIESWGLGKRFGTGIAMALGAVGAAYAGGPNQAIQIVKMGMQREAEEHRRRAAQGARRLAAKNTIYQLAQDKFTDVETQIAAAEAQIWDKFQKQLMVEAARSQSTMTRMNAIEAAKLADVQKKEAAAKAIQSNTQNELILGKAGLEGERTKLEAGLKVAGARMQREMMGAKAAIEKAKLAGARQSPVRGTYAKGPMTKEKLKPARELMAEFNPALKILEDFIAWRKQPYTTRILPGQARRGEQLISDLINTGKVFEKYGAVLSEVELKNLGAPDSANELGYLLDGLEQKRENLINRVDATLDAYDMGLTRKLVTSRGKQISKDR